MKTHAISKCSLSHTHIQTLTAVQNDTHTQSCSLTLAIKMTHTLTYAESTSTVRPSENENENEQKLKNKLVKIYCIIDKSCVKFTYIHRARSVFNVAAVYSFSHKMNVMYDDRAEYNIANN